MPAAVEPVETGRRDFGKLNRRWLSLSRPGELAVVEPARWSSLSRPGEPAVVEPLETREPAVVEPVETR